MEAKQNKNVKLLNKDELEGTFSSLLLKVRQKFKLESDDQVQISARVEENGLFVELEEDDEDLEEVLKDAVELKVAVLKDGLNKEIQKQSCSFDMEPSKDSQHVPCASPVNQSMVHRTY